MEVLEVLINLVIKDQAEARWHIQLRFFFKVFNKETKKCSKGLRGPIGNTESVIHNIRKTVSHVGPMGGYKKLLLEFCWEHEKRVAWQKLWTEYNFYKL